MLTKEVLLPEGFGPITIRVIRGKGNSKVATDTCGACMQTFKGKTAQESADKLKTHIEKECLKYRSRN